jgi:dihydrofolate reductase
MIISAIVAMDRTGVIGDGVAMPWHLPLDLRRFKARTLGKPIIMGRRTFQSLRMPLSGRLNIVLSRTLAPSAHGEDASCRLATTIDGAIRIAESYLATTGGDEVMIIGGGVIYEATVELWDRLLLTLVEGQFPGNTHFPLERVRQLRWRALEFERHLADDRNRFPHRFVRLERMPDPSSDVAAFDFESWMRLDSFGADR